MLDIIYAQTRNYIQIIVNILSSPDDTTFSLLPHLLVRDMYNCRSLFSKEIQTRATQCV